MDVGRSVAPIVGTVIGSGLAASGLIPTGVGAGGQGVQTAQVPGGQIVYTPQAPQTQYYQPAPAATPTWLMPAVAVGGLGLLALLIAKK